MADKANSDRMVSISKVEMGLAFHGIENRADICATIVAMPRSGVTREEVEAADAFNVPGNGDLNQLCETLGLEGEKGRLDGLGVIARVEKFHKNRAQQNAYNEEPAAPAENAA